MCHLTLEQRYKIETYRELGKSQKEIADYIGKDQSVISRELNRNCDQRNGCYKADLAQRKTTDDLSPEQIVGRAAKDGKKMVSAESLYQYIWADKKRGGKLYKHLRHQGKKYRKRGHLKDKRGIISNRTDIDERPTIVETKERFGDLEIDLVIGKDHQEALLTINERLTGVLFMGKVKSKEAHVIEAKAIELLKDWKPLIHTITSDNGKEFANHQNIAEQLDIDFYFAKPYHSWQRGANENLNGLVRQYFPKKTSLKNIEKQDIDEVVRKLNNRPRKRFGFNSPNEMLALNIENIQPVAFIT